MLCDKVRLMGGMGWGGATGSSCMAGGRGGQPCAIDQAFKTKVGFAVKKASKSVMPQLPEMEGGGGPVPVCLSCRPPCPVVIKHVKAKEGVTYKHTHISSDTICLVALNDCVKCGRHGVPRSSRWSSLTPIATAICPQPLQTFETNDCIFLKHASKCRDFQTEAQPVGAATMCPPKKNL